jgi:hypothetical protein
MGSRAVGRLALTVAGAIVLAALTANPLSACNATTNCPSNPANMEGVAANALPTYPEPAAEEASEPVKLKKFTKSQARRAQPRKAPATLAQRARAGEYASRKAKQRDQQDAAVPVTANTNKKFALVNANAELVEFNVAKPLAAADVSEPAPAAAPEPQATSAQPPSMELVSAEEFNDLDRAAWEANQMPKLMKLQASDSRAELREDDTRWAQTSTIGKLFVAFGALLTIGSAIRMFMA